MARTANPVQKPVEVNYNEAALARSEGAATELAQIHGEQRQAAQQLARQIGYEGTLTVGALEDEIRFYQRRSVEAVLECGKRLLVLKELTPHGEFMSRCELLGFSDRTARRFMQAAVKVSKSATVANLAPQMKNAKAFLELVTHDDDELAALDGMDDIDRMSASQLRAALRESQANIAAAQDVLDKKNQRIDKLEREKARIAAEPPDERMAAIQGEAASIAADVQGRLLGTLRQAILAVVNSGDERGQHDVFLAGLVGQVQACLSTLRQEFSLPDASEAAGAFEPEAARAIRDGLAQMRAKAAGGSK